MTKQRRGFAAMSPERRREISSLGGQAVPPDKRSFSADPSLAVSAGKAGGHAVRSDQRSFSLDPDLAAAAGRKGAAKRKSMKETEG